MLSSGYSSPVAGRRLLTAVASRRRAQALKWRLTNCGARGTGLVAPQHAGSSQARDPTQVPALAGISEPPGKPLF